MSLTSQPRQLFLVGSIAIITLCIGGLIWAIATAPPGPSTAPGFHDEGDPTTGTASSTVTIRAFGDFQCPACRAAEPGFDYVRNTYGDRVKIIWDDFPLIGTHPNALIAADAARCAQDQGKFWEYHDRLYQDQSSWSELPSPADKLNAYAAALDLKTDVFSACLSGRQREKDVMNDLQEGENNGVVATPTFFINEKKFEGGMENAQWDAEITSRLK